MILVAEGISKKFLRDSGDANYFYAVQPASLTLSPGTVTVVMGRSGSGKTTLLHMMAGLLAPSEGRVLLDGQSLYQLPDGELSRLRNAHMGVVPQGRSAIDSLTVMENILLPRALYGREGKREDAETWMDRLGIGHLGAAMPRQLSGGELRRMAIARAMAFQPACVLADEPTGDLDDENTEIVMRAFRQAADEGAAVLLVTHEEMALRFADHALRMNAGGLTPMDGVGAG